MDHKITRAKARVEEADISKRNKDLILEYCDDRANGFFGSEVGKHRLGKLLSFTKEIALRIKKDMDKVTEADIKKFIKRINEREDYSEWTRSDYKKILKLWLKWLKSIRLFRFWMGETINSQSYQLKPWGRSLKKLYWTLHRKYITFFRKR